VLQALALWSLLFRDGSFKQVPNAEIAHVAERHRRGRAGISWRWLTCASE
jgi:hypothetical protein